MAPSIAERKRKSASRDVAEISGDESDNDFGNGLLEGILSQSESEDEDGEEQDEGSEEEEEESDLDEDDLEDLESLGSDEIPSEESDGGLEVAKSKSSKTNGDALTALGFTQPTANLDDEDKPNYTVVTDANGGERYVYEEINPVYDSDDSDAQEATNTIGNIPLSFYDSYPHIGYDINGKKIMRPAKGEALDALLDSIEVPKGWTGLTDPTTGNPLNLSPEELDILKRIQTNEVPEDGYDPYPVGLTVFNHSHHTKRCRQLWNTSLENKKSCH